VPFTSPVRRHVHAARASEGGLKLTCAYRFNADSDIGLRVLVLGLGLDSWILALKLQPRVVLFRTNLFKLEDLCSYKDQSPKT